MLVKTDYNNTFSAIPVTFIFFAVFSIGCGAQNIHQLPTHDYAIEQTDIAPVETATTEVSLAVAEADRNQDVPLLVARRTHGTGEVIYEDAAIAEVSRRSERLMTCYTSAGGESAGRGVVYLLLDIEDPGHISDVLVGHSAIRGRPFINCLSRELRGLSIPTAPGVSLVQAYLVFGAQDAHEGMEMLAAYRASSTDAREAVPLSDLGRRVQRCYERVFRGYGTHIGRMVLGLTLQNDGQVASVEITEDNLDGRLDQCVLSATQNLRLDIEEGTSLTILYPVVMYPGRRLALDQSDSRAQMR